MEHEFLKFRTFKVDTECVHFCQIYVHNYFVIPNYWYLTLQQFIVESKFWQRKKGGKEGTAKSSRLSEVLKILLKF